MPDDKDVDSLRRRVRDLERCNNKLENRLSQVEKDRIEYLQNVSHQLVAPLNAIKWHIENLTANRVGVDRALKVLRSIYSQATLAVHLAKNFNLMSNLEADHALSKLKEPLQEVNLLRLMINLADDFQPLAWDNNIKMVVHDRNFDATPDVLVIKPLIGQALSNIIENAVKYSNAHSEITIQGRHLQGAGSFNVLIKNKGITIKIEEAEKIFERGFRSDEAKKKYPAGTGFGLYIAMKIVEIHEGRILVYSKDGWTVFEVVLPVQGLRGKARIRDKKNSPIS